jgi:hypothetical protein
LQKETFPQELFLNGYYTIYKNKFSFQQYIDNKIRKKQELGSHNIVGRSVSSNQSLYVKEIHNPNSPIIR